RARPRLRGDSRRLQTLRVAPAPAGVPVHPHMLGVRARGGHSPRRLARPRVGGAATRPLPPVPRGRPRPGSLKQRRSLGNEAPRSRFRALSRRPDRLDGSVPAVEADRAHRTARCDRVRGGAGRDDGGPGDADLRARAGSAGGPRERRSGVRGRRGAGRGAGPGKALGLVRQGPPFPGATLTLDPADPFLARAQKAHFTVEKETGNGVTSVRFRYREATGEGLVRTYVFRDPYVVAVKAEREGAPGAAVGLVLGPGIGNPSQEELASRYTKPGATVTLSASASVDRKANDALKEPLPKGPGLVAAGIEDNYFLTAFLPSGTAAVTLRPVALAAPPAAEGKPAAADAESEVVLSAPNVVATDVFLGPKELDVLEKTRPGMDRLINYGWYAILVKPLLWGLKAIHKVVGN